PRLPKKRSDSARFSLRGRAALADYEERRPCERMSKIGVLAARAISHQAAHSFLQSRRARESSSLRVVAEHLADQMLRGNVVHAPLRDQQRRRAGVKERACQTG